MLLNYTSVLGTIFIKEVPYQTGISNYKGDIQND